MTAKQSEWIDVHKELPKVGECVLIWHDYRLNEYGPIAIGWLLQSGRETRWVWAQGKRIEDEYGLFDNINEQVHAHTLSPGNNHVLYWKPLPEAPIVEHIDIN